MHLFQTDQKVVKKLYDEFFDNDAQSIVRYCFEGLTMLGTIFYLAVQQGGEIVNQGLSAWINGLVINFLLFIIILIS